MNVSPINFKVLAHVLDVEGFESAAALKSCGVASADELDDAGPWLPASLLDRSMAAAIEVTADACFGLVAGRSAGLMRYPIFTPLTLAAPTLRQVLEDVKHFAPLVVERAELDLVERRGSAQILVHPVVENGCSGNFRTELVAASAVHMLRFARASRTDLCEVDLPYACPPGQEPRYAAALGPHIRFGQARCVIRFDPRLLDARLQTDDPVAYATARMVAESALAAHKAGSDVAERVRRWLLTALPRQPSVRETAERFRMSERSLRRQLCMLGVTHAELAQQSCRMEAERLLAERGLPIKHIADCLGFSSVTSFHRAFRRWAGVTPAEWRAARLN